MLGVRSLIERCLSITRQLASLHLSTTRANVAWNDYRQTLAGDKTEREVCLPKI